MSSLWFAIFGFGLGMLFSAHRPVMWPALCLFVALPTLAGAAAGFAWGAPLLDTSRTDSVVVALTRGLGIAAGAFAIFSVGFALMLPVVEPWWSASQIPALLFMTFTLGLLGVGRLLALTGIIAALVLYTLARRASCFPPTR